MRRMSATKLKTLLFKAMLRTVWRTSPRFSNSDREEDVVMEDPLECHQFDWSTEAGLLEGLMILPLDNNVVKEILNGTLSDII